MKIYPVNITIEYKSGRIEKKTIKDGLDKWKRDLSLGKTFGGNISDYEIVTEQDRLNKRFGVVK